MLRFAPGETLAFSPEQNEMVAQDHVNCLYRLRSCEAEETVLLDRLGGQTALAKFMLEADRPASVDPEQAWSSFTELADRVLAAMDGAFGARALFLNRVLNEVECEPLDVEGQRPIGLLDETTRVGYIEAYFDHRRWGEEALGVLARDGALGRVRDLVDVNLLRVEEQTRSSASDARMKRWMAGSWSSRARAPASARNSRARSAPPGASRSWPPAVPSASRR